MMVFKVGVCDNCRRGDLVVLTSFAGALCYECAKAARDDAAKAVLAIRREMEKGEGGAEGCPFVGTDQPCNSCPRWDECMDGPPVLR